MKMFFKHNLVTTLFVVCCFAALCGRGSTTYCSLDRMKKFAMEACEHLFETYEIRARRAVHHGHMSNDVNLEAANYYHYVRRSNYPQGGYLKVSVDHYRKLSQLDVSPRYKAKKLSHLHREEKKGRYARDTSYSNNISYCCYHKCEEDFFC